MKYYTLHINDSGAIEYSDEKIRKGEKTLICRLYDDKEFNSINDILHSYDYVMNSKSFDLFKRCNIIPYELTPVVVKKVNINLGVFKIYNSYHYQQVKLSTPENLHCYDWINFEESDVLILRGENIEGNINSHENLLKLIQENGKISSKINEIYSLNIPEKEKTERTKNLETFSFETRKIVFNKKFDSSIDLFKIPLYSSGTYISERFKELLSNNNITDVGFARSKADLSEVWKPHYPLIEFEKSASR